MVRNACVLSLTLFLCGCWAEFDRQTKKSPNSIIGKKTQDIGEFDPNAKKKVSDSKIRAEDPLTGPMMAYGPMMEKISKLGVDQAINLFYATEGRFPKDHEEFMTRIIKENNIQLPVLPFKAKYQYDVENHKLVVIEAPAEGDGEAAPMP